MTKLKYVLTPLLTLSLVLGGCIEKEPPSDEIVKYVAEKRDEILDYEETYQIITMNENYTFEQKMRFSARNEKELEEKVEAISCLGNNEAEEELCHALIGLALATLKLSDCRYDNFTTDFSRLEEEFDLMLAKDEELQNVNKVLEQYNL